MVNGKVNRWFSFWYRLCFAAFNVIVFTTFQCSICGAELTIGQDTLHHIYQLSPYVFCLFFYVFLTIGYLAAMIRYFYFPCSQH
jgi:hypothetical protein